MGDRSFACGLRSGDLRLRRFRLSTESVSLCAHCRDLKITLTCALWCVALAHWLIAEIRALFERWQGDRVEIAIAECTQSQRCRSNDRRDRGDDDGLLRFTLSLEGGLKIRELKLVFREHRTGSAAAEGGERWAVLVQTRLTRHRLLVAEILAPRSLLAVLVGGGVLVKQAAEAPVHSAGQISSR